jgi:pyruvate ferredoxin oxidoreductase beta subunit
VLEALREMASIQLLGGDLLVWDGLSSLPIAKWQASPSYPLDLFDKVRTAKDIIGPRYIEVHAACPPGWGFPNRDLIKMGKLAIESGIHVLFEIKEGAFRLTSRSLTLAEKGRKKTAADYVKGQTRFRKITDDQIDRLRSFTDQRWEEFLERHQKGR